MMRIAVFSDTHGDLSRLPAAIAAAGEVDAFLHLGDYGADAEKIHQLMPVPYVALCGNCDYGASLPRRHIAQYENASILAVHGDVFRSVYQLTDQAANNGCQAVLFGHTHTPLVTAQGPILIVNPGSLSRPRMLSEPSFAVLSVDGRDVNVKMYSL